MVVAPGAKVPAGPDRGDGQERADSDSMADSNPPPIPADEDARVASVRATGLLDSGPEALFDTITDLVTAAFDVPISLITVVDETRQWFKAKTGTMQTETPRDDAFCAHAIARPDDLLVVEDAHADRRFSDNPLVTGEPHIRFYAGAPVRAPDGQPVGTLCVLDTRARSFDEPSRDLLRRAADQVEVLIAARIERDQAVGERGRIASEHHELEQAVEARTQFLAVAQHKLKTPLAVIAGWGGTLREWDDLSVDERDAGLDAIERSTLELQSQIDDLLDEARANLLEQSIEIESVDLGRFVTEHVATTRYDQDRHPIRIDVPPGLSARADRAALRQVLAHLLDNAVKYSPDGGEIAVSGQDRDGDVVLAVADHGIGLPEGVDVFRPFQRGGAAHSVARGTGLGLYIVRSLTTKMGGRVVAAPSDDGARFEVSLPRA